MSLPGVPIERRRLVAVGAAGGLAIMLQRTLVAQAQVSDNPDVRILQTAASIDNAVLAFYASALDLAVMKPPNANPALLAFFTAARNHHADHAQAFNDAVTGLAGRVQNDKNPFVADLVAKATGTLTDAGRVVDLALQIETVAAHTFQNAVGLLNDAGARKRAASIAGTEAQHTAVLRVVKSLVAARTLSLFSQEPGTAPKLPPEAGSVGYPGAFGPLDQARPPSDGAVR